MTIYEKICHWRLIAALVMVGCAFPAHGQITCSSGCGYFNADDGDITCSSIGWAGEGIGQSGVMDRIHRWSTENGNLDLHYEDGFGQLAFTFSCCSLQTLIQQVDTVSGSGDKTVLGAVAGIRVYFGLESAPTGTDTLTGLRLFLVPVDSNGRDLQYGYDTDQQVLGYDPSLYLITKNSSCLNFTLDTCDQMPCYTPTDDPTTDWQSYSDMEGYTGNFTSYVEDFGGDSLTGYTCPIKDCGLLGGNWLRSYTYCLELFNYLLSQEGAESLRFYFGTKKVGDAGLGRHVCVMVAVDGDGKDICDKNPVAYIDWAQPCPTLCNDGQLGNFAWGSGASTSDDPQTFDFPVEFSYLPTVAFTTRNNAGSKHVLPITSAGRDTFVIARNEAIDGTNDFNWLAVSSRSNDNQGFFPLYDGDGNQVALVQWGIDTSTSSSTQTFNFPTNFSDNCYAAIINRMNATSKTILPVTSVNKSSLSIDRDGGIENSQPFCWIAVGDCNPNSNSCFSFPFGPYTIKGGSGTSTSDDPELFEFDGFGLEDYADSCETVVINRHMDGGQSVLPVSSLTDSSFTIDRDNGISGDQDFYWLSIGQ